jgi:ABC-type molybdenum transport system ATPase subunit/photorepair protein PhrA
MALLELTNIEFNYSDKELYKDVNLRINAGEHCVLVGVNGSGKTTLLSILIGDIKPDKAPSIGRPMGSPFPISISSSKFSKICPSANISTGFGKTCSTKKSKWKPITSKRRRIADNFEKILA